MTTAPEKSRKRRRWPFLLVPYVVGIAWACVHPILSVITGEPKCRGWFIDESSLELGSLRLDAAYSPANTREIKPEYTTLCDSILQSGELRDNVECFRHGNDYHVAKIVPVSGAVEPAETLAIVVPAPSSDSDWNTSDFHNAMLQLSQRLSSPSSCPWLAKTVLVVSPTRNDVKLHSTVSLFLDSSLGSSSFDRDVSPLPMQYSFGILRNLLVVDVNVNETAGVEGDQVRILPQGRNGVLPNMDLVFATTSMYSRSAFLRRNSNSMIMHSYGDVSRIWKDEMLPSWLSPFTQQWALELANMMLFGYQLAMGPENPHIVALDKGIDSLTVEANLTGPKAGSNAVDCVAKLEGVLHSLSNLQERLHHSITQYLLPSPTKFVSHAEYLIPNLLILLPLVVRAATLILLDIPQFDFYALQTAGVVGVVSLLLTLVALRTSGNASIMNALYAIVYVAICFAIPEERNDKQRRAYGQSLQFVTCLAAIYIHVPLVLAHVSLAFPSALIWSAAIAFPTFPIQRAAWQTIKRPIVLAFALGSLALVPNYTFGGEYTPFVTTVFMPLHILIALLWLL